MELDFPHKWESILQHRVQLFQTLTQKEKLWFCLNVKKFIDNVPIVSNDCEIDDMCALLVASAAVIPQLLTKDAWHYPKLKRVLISEHPLYEKDGGLCYGYVKRESDGLELGLSKRPLIQGFEWPRHSANVAIHEFLHLVDMSGGALDGSHPLFGDKTRERWRSVMSWEMHFIKHGKSFIDQYAATDEGEFFAVAGEHYFTDPILLKTEHEKVYNFLEEVFKMQMFRRFGGAS